MATPFFFLSSRFCRHIGGLQAKTWLCVVS
jgi:hypothetical protein